MSVKKTNRTVPITLAPIHIRKLKLMVNRTGLTKSGIIQRLLEQHEVFELDESEAIEEISEEE
jgi:hypothetical protein